ncbi:MAG: low molecular weight phosphatase family protein [Anaerolineae bacterium]|nr:low molecular weight phosphatase family protein [Anaerolineae bacterium]
MKKLLFLCTGNYYRSRFAEYLFNSLVEQQGLDWQAESRGLAVERGTKNRGPISKYAVEGLKQRGIMVGENERFPQQVEPEDFTTADKVVVLDASEHRVLMEERFPSWVESVEYWTVHDLNITQSEYALGQIETQVKQLAQHLNHH